MKRFVRVRHGEWRCVEPASLELLAGRVQVVPGTVLVRGTTFMNVDLAKMLDEEYARQQGA